jgi:hypothetical protein
MLQAHVFKYFRCFVGMFQVFHADVAKVDRNVAMIVHICCKCLFPKFHPFFQTYVASVFIWMLHMFHTYVASVLSGCCICLQLFLSVFHVFLHAFQAYVSNVLVVSYVCCNCFI